MQSLIIKKAIKEHPQFKDFLTSFDQAVKAKKAIDTRSAKQRIDQLFTPIEDLQDQPAIGTLHIKGIDY